MNSPSPTPATKLWRNLQQNVQKLRDDARRDAGMVAREVKQTASSIDSGFRSTPRVTKVLGAAVSIIAQYRMHAAAEALRGKPLSRDELDARCAKMAFNVCTELRGGILKIGQILSARPDLLPAAFIESLSRLREEAPAVPFVEIEERIADELGRGKLIRFKSIDETPIGAASLAQVHRASLEDGRLVAIKVLVPGARECVEADVAALRLLLPKLEGLLPVHDLRVLCEELATSLEQELDLEREAINAERFAEAIADTPVAAPRIVREFSASAVLTMDLVEGQSVTAFLESASKPERDRILTTLAKSMFQQILHQGLFHGDPHPGNLRVDKEGQLVFIDFGCVGELDDQTRAGYVGLLMATATGNEEALAQKLEDLGFSVDESGPSMMELAGDMLSVFKLGTNLSEFDLEAEIRKAMATFQSAKGVRVPHHFVLVGRVLASLGGIVAQYKPDIELASLLAPN